MSIRHIAQELYKCQSKVHKLEDELNTTTSHLHKTELQEALRKARAELKVLKNMVEGRKSQTGTGNQRFPFSR